MASKFDGCIKELSSLASKAFGKAEAKALMDKLQETATNLAQASADKKLAGLREAAGEFAEQSLLQAKVNKLRLALTNSAKAGIFDHLKNYKDPVEGLMALWKGAENVRFGAHNSIPAYMQAAKMLAAHNFVKDVMNLSTIDGKQVVADLAAKGTLDRALAWHLSALTDKTVAIPKDLNPMEADAGGKLAKVAKNHQNDVLNKLNMQGANIVPLAGRITTQMHSPQTMLKMGKEAWTALAKKTFHTDTYGTTDPAKFLSSMYDAVSSGVRLSQEGKPDQAFKAYSGDMAQQLSQHRLVKFQDPDAFLAYREAMKQPGSLFHDILSEITRGNNNAALMARMGPDPHGMFDEIEKQLLQQYRTDELLKNRIKSALSENGRIRNIFKEVTGFSSADVNPNVSRIYDTIRAFTTVTGQWLSTIKSLPDVAAGATYLGHWGIPVWSSAGKFAKGWAEHFGAVKGNAWEQGNRQSWFFMEHYFMNSSMDWRDTSDLKGISRKTTNFLYNANQQMRWDAECKYTIGQTVSRLLGAHSDTALADIKDVDVKRSLFKYGIDSNAWDTIRQGVTGTDKNHKYVTGDAVQKLPDSSIISYLTNQGKTPTPYAIERARNDLATKTNLMFSDAGDHIITLAGPNEKAIMNQGFQRGLHFRGILDLVTQFKGYALASAYRTFASQVYGRGAESTMQALRSKNGELYWGALTIAMGIAAWYISDSAKNALLGVSPRTVDAEHPLGRPNIQNGLTALAGSGGLGPYADLVTSDMGSDPTAMMSLALGPTSKKISTAAYLAWKSSIDQIGGSIEGKKTTFPATQDMRFVADNTPGISFPPLKMALNYAILYHLENMMNPKANREHEQHLKQQTGQTYFFPPSKQ